MDNLLIMMQWQYFTNQLDCISKTKNHFDISKQYIFYVPIYRAVARFENPGGLVVMGGDNAKEWTGKRFLFNFSSIFGDFFWNFLKKKQSNKKESRVEQTEQKAKINMFSDYRVRH